MFVSDVMTARPATIGPDDTLRTAISRMKDNDCRRLPVVNQQGMLIGIITDRDTRLALHSPYVLHERWQDEALLDNITVRLCMTPTPITVEPNMDIADAVSLMLRHHIGGLPVLLGETLVGIITTTDVMTAFVRKLQRDEKLAESARASRR
jgi:acetoin utilization protein AcuB